MQGEQIIKLAEMCRKLETEEEKVNANDITTVHFDLHLLFQVLPFYTTSLSHEENDQVASVQSDPPSEALAQVST